MSDSRNVLPVLVDMATKLAGEDQVNDWLKTIRGGPSMLRVYTPADLGLAGVSLGTSRPSNWVDVAGFRTLTAFYRITGTYGGASFGLDLLASPVGAGESWGTDLDWAIGIASRQNLTAVGSFVVANTGVQNVSNSSGWMGVIARKARVDIGAAGASANGWAYLVCLP